MTTIYLAAKDDRTVISLQGNNPKPDERLIQEGYRVIGMGEFRKLKAHILRRNRPINSFDLYRADLVTDVPADEAAAKSALTGQPGPSR